MMNSFDVDEDFQESAVRLHEYLMGLGFVAAASGVIDDLRNTLRVVERQRRLQEENSIQLQEVLMRLTGDNDGPVLSAWIAKT